MERERERERERESRKFLVYTPTYDILGIVANEVNKNLSYKLAVAPVTLPGTCLLAPVTSYSYKTNGCVLY